MTGLDPGTGIKLPHPASISVVMSPAVSWADFLFPVLVAPALGLFVCAVCSIVVVAAMVKDACPLSVCQVREGLSRIEPSESWLRHRVVESVLGWLDGSIRQLPMAAMAGVL